MKKKILARFLSLFCFLLLVAGACAVDARDIPPIVSPDWLASNLDRPGLIILDVRKVEEYKEGHVPKALNAYYGGWAYKRHGLYSAIPDQTELNELIGSMGIDFDSWVVVTGKIDTPRESYKSARVACTILYAGVPNVALLDGGINNWIQKKKPVSTMIERPQAKVFQGKFRQDWFADKNYVTSRLGKIILLDVRERDYFDGRKKMDCIQQAGHIPGAFNLPTSCVFNDDYTFKGKDVLAVIAESVTGKDRKKAIVTYCDLGQCCPTWSFIMKELLGYTNVRLYDGSMQEWTKDSQAPVTK
jgi:thiosulfate/3-mercaptopyruvate sulfurtransferase